jgi:DNA-binding XRE family transcriptional regulator
MAERDVQTNRLADEVGCHPGTLTQIKRGQVKPGADLKQRIADALDSTVAELFAEVEQ